MYKIERENLDYTFNMKSYLWGDMFYAIMGTDTRYRFVVLLAILVQLSNRNEL